MADTKRFLSVNIDVFNAKYVQELINMYIDFAKNEQIPESIREELIKKAAKIIEEKDGKEEAQYFLNLMTCSTTI